MTRPTRVLVTGAGGQVGVDLVDVLAGAVPPGGNSHFQPDGQVIDADEFEVLGVTRGDLDVTNEDQVRSALAATRPDVVVHLAAYTAVDRAERDREACYAVNAAATGTLSTNAHDVGAHLITISTDYVFDGTKGDYVEGDITNPLNVYGDSKRAGELLCRAEDTVVRTSWVVGVRGTSVVHVIADRARRGQAVRFVNDQRGTVTVAADLARALVALVRARPGGCWHVANEGATTWFDLAAFVGRTLGRGDDFATPIATSELSPAPLARRPAASDLNTTKFARDFSSLPPWRESLERVVRDAPRGVRS
ncbi:MAG: dTDP-4-dehydrorhamnose reductase [Actinobacteria bacterium 21-64-8]|nr:MAG: dTDP-4-dehydrorhamnose reductase [Actinobacteria bacterium 21-64-8]